MECYNCGAPLTASNYCGKCGADVTVYKKIIMASNALYNEGLERANIRNLSGAIESLKKSLQFNKMNISARNLLGLIYFEMGETVEALSEWVISKNYQSRDNAAGYYLNEIQNNPARLDVINQTIKKYNQALVYCRQDSRDLAIIQLKKVLSLNPKLVRGHQLLALLYMQEGKYDYANKYLRNASKIDENNTTTLRYQKEVSQKLGDISPKKQKKEELISYQSGNDTVIMPMHFKDNSAMQTIINIVIGVALGIAITIFLLIPGIRQRSKSESNEAIKAANDTISTKEQSILSLENQVSDLTKQVDAAKEEADGKETKLTSYEQLLNAYTAYLAEDAEAAQTALEKVNVADLSGNASTIYRDIDGKVNEKYMESLYQEGYSAYSKGDYKTAVEKLSKVVEREEFYRDGYAVYYLAQSYRREENKEQAIACYQKVLSKYPGTERARVAQSYLNETGASQGTGSQGTQQEQTQDPQQAGTQDPQQGQPQDPQQSFPQGQ